MSVDKRVKYDVQGGVKNYLGKQKEVKAPLKWQSSPDHPTTELAYITEAEKDLLVKQDLHGSLQGGVNRGPSGIMSLNGWGSKDAAGNEVGMSGVATSAAEAGGGSGADRKELESYINKDQMTTTQLPPGVKKQLPQDIKDYRNAYIAAGGGQRVNPGFFDSRNTVSPAELAAAKAYNPTAFRKNRKGGIMDFITGGGFLGNLARGIGQYMGLGKRYNEPTYDMRSFSNVNPDYYNDLDNELMLSTKVTPQENKFNYEFDVNDIASLIKASKQQPTATDFTNANAVRLMSEPKTVTNVPFEGARTFDTYTNVDPYKMNYLNRDLPDGYRSESLLNNEETQETDESSSWWDSFINSPWPRN